MLSVTVGQKSQPTYVFDAAASAHVFGSPTMVGVSGSVASKPDTSKSPPSSLIVLSGPPVPPSRFDGPSPESFVAEQAARHAKRARPGRRYFIHEEYPQGGRSSLRRPRIDGGDRVAHHPHARPGRRLGRRHQPNRPLLQVVEDH